MQFKKTQLSVLLLAIMCVFMLSPTVERTGGDAVFFLMAILFLFLEINGFFRCSTHEKVTIGLILIYIAILFLYKTLGFSTTSVAYHLGIVKFYLTYIFLILIHKKLTRKQIFFLLLVALAAMLLTMFQNYRLKQSWGSHYSIQLYKTSGVKAIIDTQYIAAILFLSGALFCAFLHTHHSLLRYAYLLLVLICIGFNLIVTQRGIMLILSVIMFPLLLLFNSRERSPQKYILTFSMVLIVLFCLVEYRLVFSLIGNLTGSERIMKRMDSIASLIDAGGLDGADSGSLVARIRLTGVSIQTLFSSIPRFFFGVGHQIDNYDLVGNHSHFIDEFARFGIIGGLLSITVVINMLLSLKKLLHIPRNKVLHAQFLVILAVFILRGLVGGIADKSIGTVLFILLPLMFRLLLDRRKEPGPAELLLRQITVPDRN